MLNSASPLPLYQQLTERIEAGAFAPGVRLPSEPELQGSATLSARDGRPVACRICTSGDMAPMCREKKRSCHPQILSDAAEWLDTNPLS